MFLKDFIGIYKYGLNSKGKVIDYDLESNGTSGNQSSSHAYIKNSDAKGKVSSINIQNDYNTTAIPTIEFEYEGKKYTFKSSYSEFKLYEKYPIGSEIPITINTKNPSKSIYGSILHEAK
jgi:hypothetical protein